MQASDVVHEGERDLCTFTLLVQFQRLPTKALIGKVYGPGLDLLIRRRARNEGGFKQRQNLQQSRVTSFSVKSLKSRKRKSLKQGPYEAEKFGEWRPREYLTATEVKATVEAAKKPVAPVSATLYLFF